MIEPKDILFVCIFIVMVLAWLFNVTERRSLERAIKLLRTEIIKLLEENDRLRKQLGKE